MLYVILFVLGFIMGYGVRSFYGKQTEKGPSHKWECKGAINMCIRTYSGDTPLGEFRYPLYRVCKVCGQVDKNWRNSENDKHETWICSEVGDGKCDKDKV